MIELPWIPLILLFLLVALFLLYRFSIRKYMRIEIFESFDALKTAVLDELLMGLMVALMICLSIWKGVSRLLYGDEDHFIREISHLSDAAFILPHADLSFLDMIEQILFGDEDQYVRIVRLFPKNSIRRQL